MANVRGEVLSGNRNDRNAIDPTVLIHSRQHFKAIHLRNNNIQQYQQNLKIALVEQTDSLRPIVYLYKIIVFGKYVCQ